MDQKWHTEWILAPPSAMINVLPKIWLIFLISNHWEFEHLVVCSNLFQVSSWVQKAMDQKWHTDWILAPPSAMINMLAKIWLISVMDQSAHAPAGNPLRENDIMVIYDRIPYAAQKQDWCSGGRQREGGEKAHWFSVTTICGLICYRHLT